MSEDTAVMPAVRVTKMTPIRIPANGTRAFADVLIGEHYVVKGIRVMEGPKGLFIAMPGRQVREGSYIDIFRPVTKEGRELLHGMVMAAYKLELKAQEALSR